MRPWITLGQVDTPEGLLQLRQRGERTFLMTIGGRVLMTSEAHRSEDELAALACSPLRHIPRPRIVIGGMGMGFTLRAALDILPRRAEVLVVDLNPTVLQWCRGPLAPLTNAAIADPRVRVEVADVAHKVKRTRPGALDAIIIDLYEGPHETGRGHHHDPLYGTKAIESAAAALRPGGIFAVWAEEPDATFERRLAAGEFSVERHRRGGGRSHVVYIAKKLAKRRAKAIASLGSKT